VATRLSSEPPPAGLEQMLPDVPAKARNTIHGKFIMIRVQADSAP
jgi:hypothetical protein